MIEKTMKSYLSMLLDLKGVLLATIISRDGFVIESVMKSDIAVDDFGAVVCTGFGSTEVMGREIQLNFLNQTIFEFDDGKMVLAACGDQSILAVVANKNAIIGNIRHNMNRILESLAKFL